jgi:2-keto-4-pentenoate hydratase/2-oxohepta-3-ene-1,7-dioic acid hydratase in catechol pathway
MSHWVRFAHSAGAQGFGQLQSGDVIEFEGSLFGDKAPTGRRFPLGEVTLLAPCEPSKMLALWNNFHALAAKLEKSVPGHPLFLIKPSTCINGPSAPIRRPSQYAGKIVYEGELGIVIGRRCQNVSPDDAAAHIFGYTCVNDVTAAQLLDEDPNFAQWTRAKGFDGFGCIGPSIATEIDFAQAHVRTVLDGAERQNYPLSDMIFSPAHIVSHVSHDLTLLPGDVIACGTSIGVGSMKDGARVSVSIDGIGSLDNQLLGPSA